MKHLLLLSIISIFSCNLSAQNLKQVSIFVGTGKIGGADIATDAANNIYTIGNFSDMVDFEPGANAFNLTSIGTVDAFVTKLNTLGNLIWAKQLGGAGRAFSTQLSLDALGYIYVSGFFDGTVDFDPGINSYPITSNGGFDSFILKLDNDGNFIWAKRFGGNDADRSQAIAVDASGNVYSTGLFNLTVDFDPGSNYFPLTSTGGDYNVYISKLDTDGNFVWAKHIGGSNSSVYSNDIAVDTAHNIYSTGYYRNGSPDFDPGSDSFLLGDAGSEKMYISKLDTDGNFVWAKQVYGTVINNGNSIAIASNNLIVSGFFIGIQDFDPGASSFELESSGLGDAYVLKLDTDGNFGWVKQISGAGRNESNSVKIDADGSIVNAGTFQDIADFDVSGSTFNLTSKGYNDAYVHKMDASGKFLWASQIGGEDFEFVGGLAIDNNNDILSTGYFYGTTDFDPGTNNLDITSSGESDAFILKLNSNTLGILENSVTKFLLYPTPTDKKFTIVMDRKYMNVSVQIYNILGQIISTENYISIKTIEQEINASAGIYFVKVSTAKEGSTTLKLIKQ